MSHIQLKSSDLFRIWFHTRLFVNERYQAIVHISTKLSQLKKHEFHMSQNLPVHSLKKERKKERRPSLKFK